jgi:hypothetical protein
MPQQIYTSTDLATVTYSADPFHGRAVMNRRKPIPDVNLRPHVERLDLGDISGSLQLSFQLLKASLVDPSLLMLLLMFALRLIATLSSRSGYWSRFGVLSGWF